MAFVVAAALQAHPLSAQPLKPREKMTTIEVVLLPPTEKVESHGIGQARQKLPRIGKLISSCLLCRVDCSSLEDMFSKLRDLVERYPHLVVSKQKLNKEEES